MTNEQSYDHSSPDQTELPSKRFSTRHNSITPPPYDPEALRIGRRESEPHSSEVTYIFDVLSTNFPQDRTIWDLHHYFPVEGEEIDIQFDISYFRKLQIPFTLSSYKAKEFQNRIPEIAINILSKSTWWVDLGENLDKCRLIKVPIYIIFCPYHVATSTYKPPFLRVYFIGNDGQAQIKEQRKITIKEGQSPDQIQTENLIDLGEKLPFRLGLMELKQKHQGNVSLFRLILVNPTKTEMYYTAKESLELKLSVEKARAEQEKARAEQEKARADKLQRQLDDLNAAK